MTVQEFLRKKGILDCDKNHWYVKFENGNEFNIDELMTEFAKIKVKEHSQ